MDVNCFQNLAPVQPAASLASQSVSSKRNVKEARGFASELENAVAAKQLRAENNTRQDAAKNLDNPVQENEIIDDNQKKKPDDNLQDFSESQDSEKLPNPEELTENAVFMQQPLPQSDLPQPAVPEKSVSNAMAQRLEQTEALVLKGNFVGENNNLNFKPADSLTAKEQTNPETAAFNKGQQATPNSLNPALSQNAEGLAQPKENLAKDYNTLANQAELLKNTADASQPSQTVLESPLAKAVPLSPKTLEINAGKQAVSQIITPESELLADRVVNLTEKKSSDLADQQRQNGQQSQADKMPFPNTEAAVAAKNSDPAVNSGITFNVPTDVAANSKVEPPTTPGSNAPNFTLPQDQFQIRSQIVNQALLINKENQESEMVIRLKPEHLGDLTLKVNVSNGIVNANFHSNNSEVRGILEASLHQLKQDLANAGFKVDNVSISAGLSQFTAEQERQLSWQRQTSRTTGKKAGNGYVEGVDAQITSRTGVNFSKDDGVDYLI